ncbi:DUF418 domain-containing protein [Streptomyces sp. ODS28]|uniref:DUF418 domain-containing protein n=1 Tax=Streptomyces sp. ODS28 TaxID=3136688 RepID=UPI0031EAC51D
MDSHHPIPTAPASAAPATGPMPAPVAPAKGSARSSARSRIGALDALRGFALCGILFVNVPQIVPMHGAESPGHMYPIREFLDLAVQNRFFPVFSFLFGISFVLFLDGSASRAERPRVLLLRRLVALGVLGAGHQFLQPGEALLPYAIVGLLILLPATWLPRQLALAAGVLGSIAGVTVVSGGILLIPGLFLLGMGVARYGVMDTLEERGRQLGVLFAVSAVASVPALVWQATISPLSPLATRTQAIAGLLMAVAYTTGFLLLMRTPLRGALAAFFAPLGRMALTNYLTATLAVVALAPLLHLPNSGRWGTAVLLAVGILVVQALWSRWWLGRFRYGPAEWAWRCVTWWNVVPLRATTR